MNASTANRINKFKLFDGVNKIDALEYEPLDDIAKKLFIDSDGKLSKMILALKPPI